MRTVLSVTCCLPVFLSLLCAQGDEPVVSKDSLSVHTVERGDMPIRERATGSIVSLQPRKARLTLSDQHDRTCKVGQTGSAQLNPSEVLKGKIVSVDRRNCEIDFADALPAAVRIGARVNALVETGVMQGVIFFERPAAASAKSDALLFVVEAGDRYARRVAVHCGQLSGSMIQVLSGLAPGDRVIVTDTSKWNAIPRLRLEYTRYAELPFVVRIHFQCGRPLVNWTNPRPEWREESRSLINA